MAVHLPMEGAVYRTLHEHWQRTMEIDLLREIEHGIRVIAWQNGSGKAWTYPDRLELPWDPPAEGTLRGDRMSLEEADEWLGWSKPKEA